MSRAFFLASRACTSLVSSCMEPSSTILTVATLPLDRCALPTGLRRCTWNTRVVSGISTALSGTSNDRVISPASKVSIPLVASKSSPFTAEPSVVEYSTPTCPLAPSVRLTETVTTLSMLVHLMFLSVKANTPGSSSSMMTTWHMQRSPKTTLGSGSVSRFLTRSTIFPSGSFKSCSEITSPSRSLWGRERCTRKFTSGSGMSLSTTFTEIVFFVSPGRKTTMPSDFWYLSPATAVPSAVWYLTMLTLCKAPRRLIGIVTQPASSITLYSAALKQMIPSSDWAGKDSLLVILGELSSSGSAAAALSFIGARNARPASMRRAFRRNCASDEFTSLNRSSFTSSNMPWLKLFCRICCMKLC
mmetsp:Transcript_43567/g.83144  ORF Transcript_43567/g.83144 Transcript_43567/m.83144 type:complete len:359 (-) Transcript_43567:577-1653(-)